MITSARDDPVLCSLPDLLDGDERPSHIRIEEWLKGLISSGKLKPEQRLPSEVDLASALGVSRMTLRQALGSLETKGLLLRKRGRSGGNFVSQPRFEFDISGLPGFTEQISRSNAQAGARVIEAATHVPSADARQALRLRRGEKVHRIIRVRSVNQEPVALENASYPAALFPDFLSRPLTGSLYALLYDYGHTPYSATEVLDPVNASGDQAKLLQMNEGSPLMLVQRTVCDTQGRPVEYSLDYFRPDRMRITLRAQVDGLARAEVEAAPPVTP